MPLRAWLAGRPAREGFAVWAAIFSALAIFKLTIGRLPYGGSLTGALAVGLLLWSPTEMNQRLGRHEDDGLTFRFWKRDALLALVAMAVVFLPFVGAFRVFLLLLDSVIPHGIAEWLTPYRGASAFHWRVPWESSSEPGMLAALVDQIRLPRSALNLIGGNIAVALAEEFFYRGYLLRRFSEQWTPHARLLGVPFGAAMLAQTSLFAFGHLLTPAIWRLATFFPGLLFGWLAAKSGRVIAPAIVHASSNLLIATLEASAFGT